MLIRFNVKNFLSYDTRPGGKSEEFSLIAGEHNSKNNHISSKEEINLLRFAAIYGANAAGKSNIVKAMKCMRDTVLFGLPKGHNEMYCKIRPENKGKTSYFEMEILIRNKVYAYGFEAVLSQSRFVSEWLVQLLSNGKEQEIFLRDITTGKYAVGDIIKKDKDLEQTLNVYMKDLAYDDTGLFLRFMNQNQKRGIYRKSSAARIFQDVSSWFSHDLRIHYPNQPISSYSYLTEERNLRKIARALSSLGTGIESIEFVTMDWGDVQSRLPNEANHEMDNFVNQARAEMNRLTSTKRGGKMVEAGMMIRSNQDFFFVRVLPADVQYKMIKFKHKSGGLFRLGEESEGTKRLLDLLEILLMGRGKTYVIDELDRCLHPSLTYEFVKLFLEMARDQKTQLIATTHESRLLDFNLLRRDEVWFVDKKEQGNSDIYSLEEYNARFDSVIDKAYLEGRYGGIPIFTTLFPLEDDSQ